MEIPQQQGTHGSSSLPTPTTSIAAQVLCKGRDSTGSLVVTSAHTTRASVPTSLLTPLLRPVWMGFLCV